MDGGLKKQDSLKYALLYLVMTGFAAFLLFSNLGDRLLWGDEAETANLAVNITKFGIPQTFDGKNTITLFGSAIDANGNGIWVWSPWLKEYLAAFSFDLFGQTTTAARLPFAIAALAAVVLLMFVAFRIYADHRVSIGSAALFLSSDLFILHARQCRYYSIIMAAQILLVYGVYLLLSRRKWGPSCIVFALVVQFYSNYIVVGGNVIALFLFLAFLFLRNRRLVKEAAFGMVSFTLLVAPWLWYAQPWKQAKEAAKEGIFGKLLYYFSEINFHVVPLVVLFIPLTVYLVQTLARMRAKSPEEDDTIRRREIEWFLWAQIPCHLLFVSLAPGVYLRYLLPLVPVLFLLTAAVMLKIRKPLFQYFAYAVLVVMCLSNAVSVACGYPFRGDHHLRLPLINTVREITTPYDDRLKDVVSFLNQNARPDQSLLVFDPEFPLIFYTHMKVIDARLDKDPLRDGLPNWILSQSASGVAETPALMLPPDLASRYEKIVLNVHDSARGGSIPEPDCHESFTASTTKELVIYKKMR